MEGVQMMSSAMVNAGLRGAEVLFKTKEVSPADGWPMDGGRMFQNTFITLEVEYEMIPVCISYATSALQYAALKIKKE